MGWGAVQSPAGGAGLRWLWCHEGRFERTGKAPANRALWWRWVGYPYRPTLAWYPICKPFFGRLPLAHAWPSRPRSVVKLGTLMALCWAGNLFLYPVAVAAKAVDGALARSMPVVRSLCW